VLAFIEALRHGRRSFHTVPALRDDPVRRQTVRWQFAFLKDAEPVLREYLHDIGGDLTRLLESTGGRGRREILKALAELQADSDDVALTLLGDATFEDRVLALRCLRYSKSPLAPAALCGIARHALTGERSARWLRRLGVGRKPVPAEEIREALRALRGHPSDETERVLLHYAGRTEAAWRVVAFGSLGWWEPVRRDPCWTARFEPGSPPSRTRRRRSIRRVRRVANDPRDAVPRKRIVRRRRHSSLCQRRTHLALAGT
jgi:hypothetical protein